MDVGFNGVLAGSTLCPVIVWYISVRFSLLPSRFGTNQRGSRDFQMKSRVARNVAPLMQPELSGQGSTRRSI